MNKRVYVDADRYKTLTIKLCVGQSLEATFTIDELHKILVNKLYGKNKLLLSECCSAEPNPSYQVSGEDVGTPIGICSNCSEHTGFIEEE